MSLLALLALPTSTLADVAAGTLTLTTDAVISLSGGNLSVTGNAGGQLVSINVGSSSFDLVMPVNAYIELNSPDKYNLTISDSSLTVVTACSVSGQTYAITNKGSATSTVTITPKTTTCTPPNSGGGGGSSSSSGGGGGGGGGSSTPVVPASSATSATVANTLAKTSAKTVVANTIQQQIADTLAKVAAIQGQLQTLPSGVPSGAASTVAKITVALKLGSTGNSVKAVQQVLNADPDTRVSTTGVGSPGKETTTFGSATVKAIQKFQEKYGIAKKGDQGYGNLGPKTRAKLSEVAKGANTAPAATPAPATAPKIETSAAKSSSSDIQSKINDTLVKVKALQEQLKTLH